MSAVDEVKALSRFRSERYPFIDLKAASRVVLQDLKNWSGAEIPREKLSEYLGYVNPKIGASIRKLGALFQFGFVDRKQRHYNLTELGHMLRSPFGDKAYCDALLLACRKPPLYRAIIERLINSGETVSQTAMFLARDFKIAAKVAPKVAADFQASLSFAGLVDAEGHVQLLGAASIPRSPTPCHEIPLNQTAGRQGSLRLILPIEGVSRKDVHLIQARLNTEGELLKDYLAHVARSNNNIVHLGKILLERGRFADFEFHLSCPLTKSDFKVIGVQLTTNLEALGAFLGIGAEEDRTTGSIIPFRGNVS